MTTAMRVNDDDEVDVDDDDNSYDGLPRTKKK